MAAIEELCILSNLEIEINLVTLFAAEGPIRSLALKLSGCIRVSVFIQKKKKSVYHICKKVCGNVSKNIL